VLVLASASPRRAQLVALLGLPGRLAPQSVDEDAYGLPDPFLAALNLAVTKARAATLKEPTEVALGADTIVALEGQQLAKPRDAREARAMLDRLRARQHRVLTGVALRGHDGREWGAVVETSVHMRPYTDHELRAYVERGEPYDKAGGYAIQDLQFRPVERIVGCFLNVVGLPLCAVSRGLETLGLSPKAPNVGLLAPPCPFCELGRALLDR
jgi:MAF protein